MRILIGDNDWYNRKPLYEQILFAARDMGIAGATITRGFLAYGPASRSRQVRLVSEDVPIVIDTVDSDEKIKALLPVVDKMMDSGIVFTQKASVARYGSKAKRGARNNTRKAQSSAARPKSIG